MTHPPSYKDTTSIFEKNAVFSYQTIISLVTPIRRQKGFHNNLEFRSHFVKNNDTQVFKIDFKNIIRYPVQCVPGTQWHIRPIFWS